MTPDLERAARALWNEFCPGIQRTPTDMHQYMLGVDAALRALENPSPEVVEAMAKAMFEAQHAYTVWEDALAVRQRTARTEITVAWRAGLNAILAAEGEE